MNAYVLYFEVQAETPFEEINGKVDKLGHTFRFTQLIETDGYLLFLFLY